jgi:hypothetical protein
MIDYVERAAGAPAPAAIRMSRQPPPSRPAGSVLAIPRGEIAGDVRLLERSDRDRTATYEVLVSNGTLGPLAAFAYAVEAGRGPGRGPGRMTWNAIVVPPLSAIAVEIEIAIPRRGRAPRVVAEVHAEDAQLTLDSAPALARFSPAKIRTFAAGAVALVLACGTLVGVAGARPRVAALAAPPAIAPGSEISVAYALANASGGEYTIEEPNGLQVRRGTVRPGSGAFTVALPENPPAGGYDLHLFAHGRLGSDERSTHLALLPPPSDDSHARPGVRIAKLSLGSDTVMAGTPIIVAYRTAAHTGSVRLIDEYGTVRAEALLSRSGTSILAAPLVDADQDLRIVVTTERGADHDEAQIPVRVLRAGGGASDASTAVGGNVPAPAVPALAPLPGAADPEGATIPVPMPDRAAQTSAGQSTARQTGADPAAVTQAPPDGAQGAQAPAAQAPAADPDGIRHAIAIPVGPPIAVAKSQAADEPIVVRVLHYEPKMHVAVLGVSGEELEGADVKPGDTAVSLSSPHDLGTKHPSVIATYSNGSEEEMVVRPVHVR